MFDLQHEQQISLFSNCPDQLRGPLRIPISGYGGPSLENKAVGEGIYPLKCINKIQQDATVCRYLSTAKSLSACFGCPSHPSSGEHKTVTAVSGTGHSM